MPPPPNLLPLLARAADLRAAGTPWDSIAQHLRRSPETVRRWPRLYPAAWSEALREARARFAADAAAEGVLMLRQLLRSDDEKIRRDAARLLASLRPSAEPDPASGDDARRIAVYLQEISDAEVETLLDEFRSAAPPEPGRPAAD